MNESTYAHLDLLIILEVLRLPEVPERGCGEPCPSYEMQYVIKLRAFDWRFLKIICVLLTGTGASGSVIMYNKLHKLVNESVHTSVLSENGLDFKRKGIREFENSLA